MCVTEIKIPLECTTSSFLVRDSTFYHLKMYLIKSSSVFLCTFTLINLSSNYWFYKAIENVDVSLEFQQRQKHGKALPKFLNEIITHPFLSTVSTKLSFIKFLEHLTNCCLEAKFSSP